MKPYFYKILYHLKGLFSYNYKRCSICLKIFHKEETNLGMCYRCWERLNKNTSPFCPVCGKIYKGGIKGVLCKDCRKKPKPWDKIGFFGVYQGLLKELILSYKFKNRLFLSMILGELLIKAYDDHLSSTPTDMIVPVPIYKDRLRQRGFNQSLELAKYLKKYTNKIIDYKSLKKIRPTLPQVELNYEKRWENLRGAFWADAKKFKGKRVLLIDDVYTTGATVFMCSKTLKKAGADKVYILVIAKTKSL